MSTHIEVKGIGDLVMVIPCKKIVLFHSVIKDNSHDMRVFWDSENYLKVNANEYNRIRDKLLGVGSKERPPALPVSGSEY